MMLDIKKIKVLNKYLIYFFLILLAIIQIFPLLWVANYSLCKTGDLFGDELLKIPNPPQFNNYVRAFIDGKILQYFINSILIVSSSVFFAGLFSFMAAYACIRLEWKLRIAVYSFIMLGMVIPIHTTLLPNFLLFKYFKLLNNYLGLIIPYIAFNLSFNTLIITGIIKTLPKSLEESAVIEGCNIWQIIFKIIAPLSKAGFVTIGVMTFLNCWNEFIMANTYISKESLKTLPFAIIKFTGQYTSDYAIQFACMTLVTIPPIILFFFFNKYIMSGVTVGAIKG